MALSVSDMTALAQSAGFDSNTAAIMGAIGMAESSGNPNVVNSIGCVGLWQINQPVWVKQYPGWTKAWLKTPSNNAKAAKVIYDSQGLAAWQAYTGPDGKGSDGPWKKYYKGSSSTTTAQDVGLTSDISGVYGKVFDAEGNLLGKIPGVGAVTGTVSGTVQAAETAATALVDTGKWITNASNWLRVLYFAGGAALLIAGVAYLGKGTAINAVAGQAIKAVKPALSGGKAKGIAKGITK